MECAKSRFLFPDAEIAVSDGILPKQIIQHGVTTSAPHIFKGCTSLREITLLRYGSKELSRKSSVQGTCASLVLVLSEPILFSIPSPSERECGWSVSS